MEFVTFENDEKCVAVGFNFISITRSIDCFINDCQITIILKEISGASINEFIDFIGIPLKIILKDEGRTVTQQIIITEVHYNGDSKELFLGITSLSPKEIQIDFTDENIVSPEEIQINYTEENPVTQNEESEDYCPYCGSSY